MTLIRGLSGRLLLVTVAVVMAVEVIIFVPSVARFRVDYLEERVARANLAAYAVLAAPDMMVTPEMERNLLGTAGVLNVVLRMGDRRALLLSAPEVPDVAATHDLRALGPFAAVGDALARLTAPRNEVVRVIGRAEGALGVVEVTVETGPLQAAMLDYGLRILRLSLVISLLTAAVVFLVIRRLVVSPLMGVVENVTAFREDPENPDRIMRPSGRTGEVAEAEAAIAGMQQEVRRALRERARLAELGAAVSKISHDLRNMLSAQQLLLDRLEASQDPMVARVMPKMIGALDRAIRLCQRTLDHGRAEEAPPELREVALRPLVEEVGETLGLGRGNVALAVEIDEARTVPADPEQLYRVLSNLMRNASEAIAETGRAGEIRVTAAEDGGEAVIRVADTGPGLPERARQHLFQPFRGGARRGGTGLGLSIAQELVEAHGGRLELVSSTTEGTVFEIRLPARARLSQDAA